MAIAREIGADARSARRADEHVEGAAPNATSDRWLATSLLVASLGVCLIATLAIVLLPLAAMASPLLLVARQLAAFIGRWQLPRRRRLAVTVAPRLVRRGFGFGLPVRARGVGSASS